MTNKRNKFYQIGFFIMTFAFITLCAYMGITAIQKSLTLNLKFTAQPSKLIHIEYKLPSESNNAYKTLFCNVTDANEGLIPNVTASASLSGDTLTLTDSFDTLGRTFDFRITNYNDYDLKVTCAGVSKNTISDGNPIVFSNISTGGANVVFGFAEYFIPTIIFDFNGGKIGESEYVESKSETLPSNVSNGYIPTRDGYTFAGYYSVDSTPEVIPDASKKCYSYDYLTNTAGTGSAAIVDGINTSISDDTTLHARWLPFTVGTYVNTGATLFAEGANTVEYPTFEGYKYVKFANAQNSTDRWIIIGASASLSSVLPSTAPTGSTKNLENSEVLVLSERAIQYEYYDNNVYTYSTSADVKYGLYYQSDVRYLCQSYTTKDPNTQKGINTNLDMSDYTAYMVSKTLHTSWYYKESTDPITSKTWAYENDNVKTEGDYMFLLAYNYTGGRYSTQEFLISDYLGEVKDPRHIGYNRFGDRDGVWWLRSGYLYSSGSAFNTYSQGVSTDGVDDMPISVRPAFVLNLA